MESCFLSEIYVLDVILNRSPVIDLPVEAGGALRNKAALSGDLVDNDGVLLVRSYHEDNLDNANNYKFRTMILFLPQCGVFYCARECHSEEVGVSKTLSIALDISWLRLVRMTDSDGNESYTFGDGGYVKRFHEEVGPCFGLVTFLEPNETFPAESGCLQGCAMSGQRRPQVGT